MDKHVVWCIPTVEEYPAVKRNKLRGDTQQHGWISETLQGAEGGRHRRLHAAWFHLSEVLEELQPAVMKAEPRLSEAGSREDGVCRGQRELRGGDRNFLDLDRNGGHTFVCVWDKTHEVHT